MRVLGLTSGDADDLDAAEREHHHCKGGNQATHAIGHEAAVLEQVADTHGLPGAYLTEAEGHDAEAGQDHRHDGADLEQRQPEFHFAKDLDVAQVEAADQEDDAQHPDPAGHFREPEAHVDTEGGDIGDGDDDHLEGVGPAEDEAGHGAEVGACIVAERAGDRVVHGHFAEGAHDHEYGGAADQVGQQHGRAGHLDGRGGTVEQPGADGGAEGHETDVAGT